MINESWIVGYFNNLIIVYNFFFLLMFVIKVNGEFRILF